MSTPVDLERSVEPLVSGAAELGIRLDRVQADRFRLYYSELVDWNRRANLTAVTGWEEVQAGHFLDSLAVSAVLPPGLLTSGGRVLDVGSGAGFPGVPLKIAFPKLQVTVLDATAKKTAFLSHLADTLDLHGLQVLTGRAETLAHDPALRESFGVVVSRAVAKLPVLAELTLGFCQPRGIAVLHKSEGVETELSQAEKALEAMGARLREARRVGEGGRGRASVLVVLDKDAPTPEEYPRRAGIPAKRPL